MRLLALVLCSLSTLAFADGQIKSSVAINQLTLEGATQIAQSALESAKGLGKNVAVAVVGIQGETLLIYKGDGVGPHNTEAARRKAFTSLSTKTPTLELLRKAKSNPDTLNLAELPELLLLSGGHPLWKNGDVIGAIGIAGGGSPENDDLIASKAGIPQSGISTKT